MNNLYGNQRKLLKILYKNCRCGTYFTVPNTQMKKLSSFSCPICNRALPNEYLDKIKSCLSLIDECHIVHTPKNVSNGVLDLGYDFTINFVE